MKILNLGCGTKASSNQDVVNIDWSVHLRLKKNRFFRTVMPLLVKGERLKSINELPGNIMLHDLSKGLPFGSGSVDVIYHSHLLEHLDRNIAKKFLLEVKRVLKVNGIQRIIVPDLEVACRAYISSISISETDHDEARKHDSYVAAIIEQSVRREASGTSHQQPMRRFIENALLGDARQRGETHQWMYDRINLAELLLELGYKNPLRLSYDTSQIPNWNVYGLDVNEHGCEYKPGSLYMEAQK